MAARRWPIIFVLLVLALAAASAWYWISHRRTGEPPYLQLYGHVEIREVQLAFEVGGRIQEILVEEGDHVAAGEVLARLDDERFRFESQRAEAQVENQKQVVAALEEGSRPEEIREAQANVSATQARLTEAERNLQRIEALVPARAATEQELDLVRRAYRTAVAEHEAAQAHADLVLAGPRQQDILAAHARLRQLEAEQRLAERSLRLSQLRAPSDGVIRNRILEPGDMAGPEVPVFTISRLQPVWIRAYISGRDLGKIRPGMPAEVFTDTHPTRPYRGQIGFISPTAEFTPKTVQTEELRTSLVYEVRVHVDNPRDELRLGMPATVRVATGEQRGSSADRSDEARGER